MCLGKVKVQLLFIIIFVLIAFYFYVCSKTCSVTSKSDANTLSNRSPTVSLLCNGRIKSTAMLNERNDNYKYKSLLWLARIRLGRETNITKLNENSEAYRNRKLLSKVDDSNSSQQINAKHSTEISQIDPDVPIKRYLTGSSEKKNWKYRYVFYERLRKRSATDNDNGNKGLSKGKQKKAKALGRLLLNNVSNKNDEDIQDDYIDDDDGDYSDGVNKKKMNWEDYQNEDGSSIMELIALNTKHKTYMQRNESFY